MTDSTTREQATVLWCDVIAPRGGDATNAIVETMRGDGFTPPAACPAD